MSARFKTLLAVAIIIAASVPLARGNEQPAMPQNSEAPRNDEQRKDQVAEPPIIRSEADRSKGRQTTVPADPAAVFAAKILGSTEDIWSKILPEQTKKQYTPTAMVLYRAATRSACGSIKTDIGAFYCPVDKKIYLDMDYANKMLSKGGMPADYFYTYSITREVGYHVQDVLGILGRSIRGCTVQIRANHAIYLLV
jgi:predicted metalloprotease